MKYISPLIKITDSCNFNCEFCYYAQKQFNNNLSKKIMPLDLLKKIIKETCEYNLKRGNKYCHLIFHGGEPMLAGLDYFNAIMEYEDECRKIYPGVVFNNSIQTNGFAINDDWIKFFKDNDFGVSISIDGDANLNFHVLRNPSIDSNGVVMNNLKKLIENDIFLTVMSVITNKHIGKEEELYNFYKNNNIKNVAFCFCYNKDSDDSVDPKKLGEFLKNFFDLYYNGTYELQVRDFESIFCYLLGKSNGLCLYSNRKDCGCFPTIDSSGNVYFCDVATEKDKAIGNFNEHSFEEIFEQEKFKQNRENSQKILKDYCKNCSSKDLCGKICYRTDIVDSNGKVKNYFCDSYKEIIMYVKKIMDRDLNK